jgi:transcription elongation factor GreA
MNNRFPISQDGLDKLKKELAHLKNVERPKIINDIAEARMHGDLSENAEYHAAREKQSFTEAKISELDYKILRSEVIDVSKIQGSSIKYGATVKLLDEETEKEVVYKIVSEYEANVAEHLISISSPLAKALLGKKEGDSLEFKTPKGLRYYEVLSIAYV